MSQQRQQDEARSHKKKPKRSLRDTERLDRFMKIPTRSRFGDDPRTRQLSPYDDPRTVRPSSLQGLLSPSAPTGRTRTDTSWLSTTTPKEPPYGKTEGPSFVSKETEWSRRADKIRGQDLGDFERERPDIMTGRTVRDTYVPPFLTKRRSENYERSSGRARHLLGIHEAKEHQLQEASGKYTHVSPRNRAQSSFSS